MVGNLKKIKIILGVKMNIYEIKKELNSDKEVRRLKTKYKKLTGTAVSIVIKNSRRYENITVAIGLSFKKDGNEYDFLPAKHLSVHGHEQAVSETCAIEIKNEIIKMLNNEIEVEESDFIFFQF